MDNFADNSAGYQIMPNQEPCKDEAVRSHLLSHIYSKHKLKTRFIYGLGSGEAIFNVDAARGYVALYNEYVANVVAVIHIGSGMPARGGELETYRIRNSHSCARSTYFLGRNIFFCAEYS